MPDDNGDLGVAPGGYPLGMRPSPPDERDRRYPTFGAMLASDELPEEYLPDYFPPCGDQGVVERCVADNGLVVPELLERAELGYDVTLSRQFAYHYRPNSYYYQGRGMIPREFLATLRNCGCPPESFWPGNDERGAETRPEPFDAALEAALPHRIGSYVSVNPVDVLERKSAIFTRKAITVGVPVHTNFVPDSDGVIPLPKGNLRGYHLMVAPAWLRGLAVTRNSYTPNWGGVRLPDGRFLPGYCLLPWNFPMIETWTQVDRVTEFEATLFVIEGEPIMYINGRPHGPVDLAPFLHEIDNPPATGDKHRFCAVLRHIVEGLGGEITAWDRYPSSHDKWPSKMWFTARIAKPWPRRS